jgi:hypothetical protein
MADRSTRIEVRNPILALPSTHRLQALMAEASPALQAAFRDALNELAADASERAEQSWRKSKGPVAVYWRAVSTYAKHIKRAIVPAKPLSPCSACGGRGWQQINLPNGQPDVQSCPTCLNPLRKSCPWRLP